MMLALTIIVFIFIIGLLIFVHEWGHFLVAKKSGVKVEEFAFGFPPRLFSWKRGETRYAINAIPLGGYVKMLGEEENVKEPGSYFTKPVLTRALIVVAGVFMNFVLAIVLMTIGFSIGMTPIVSDPATLSGQKNSQVMVVFVSPDSPAQKAGIVRGNILSGFSSPEDLQKFTREHTGQEVDLVVKDSRNSKPIKTKLSDNKDTPLGVGVVTVTTVKQPVWQALITSITETGKAIGTIFVFLGTVIKSIFSTGSVGPAGEGVVGPVGLFNFTSEALKLGWIYVLQLVAILSINLGLINILPFPALDGGKILFITLEGFFRRKVVRAEIENIIHLVGFALLILLLIAITYRDITKWF